MAIITIEGYLLCDTASTDNEAVIAAYEASDTRKGLILSPWLAMTNYRLFVETVKDGDGFVMNMVLDPSMVLSPLFFAPDLYETQVEHMVDDFIQQFWSPYGKPPISAITDGICHIIDDHLQYVALCSDLCAQALREPFAYSPNRQICYN